MTHADTAIMAAGTSRDHGAGLVIGGDPELDWLREQHPYAKITRTGGGYRALLGTYHVDGPTAAGVDRSLAEHMYGGGLTGG
jgi:hypothetical protein